MSSHLVNKLHLDQLHEWMLANRLYGRAEMSRSDKQEDFSRDMFDGHQLLTYEAATSSILDFVTVTEGQPGIYRLLFLGAVFNALGSGVI